MKAMGVGQPASVAPPRAWLLLAGLGYLVFVVYGSLVPLNYTPLAWNDAVLRFQQIPYLKLGIDSRADWVANALLFIPLTFVWAGACWPVRGIARQGLSALTVVLAAALLSIAIEFTQLYFPERTVSINDIAAEMLGGAIGTLLWCAQGRRFSHWTHSLALTRGTLAVSQKLLTFYLLALFGYNILPLDLTISPAEIYHKWQAGKIILVPFTAAYADWAHQAYDIATDALLWAPVAVLWRQSGRRSAAAACWFVVGNAALLELMQLFVYSRVTDTTDIITALAGALIGSAVARPGRQHQAKPTFDRPGAGPWAVGVLLWLGMLAVVFWYPFDFRLERGFLQQRLADFTWMPFKAYYQGSEFRAATEVLHKTLFTAPLGVMLVLWRRRLPAWVPGVLSQAIAIATMAGCAIGIEAGQVLLPGKNADITDAALEFAGALIGYLACSALTRQQATSVSWRTDAR